MEFKRLRYNDICMKQVPFNDLGIEDGNFKWSIEDYDKTKKLMDEKFSENDANLLK
jgi:hypothetical protein